MSNAKITYIQATEDCYSRMSDAKFVKEFEKIHEKDISENYTVIQPKFFLFLKPILMRMLIGNCMMNGNQDVHIWKCTLNNILN